MWLFSRVYIRYWFWLIISTYAPGLAVLETPRETSGAVFNPYRRGTAAAQRAALKKRNKQRSKKK